MLQHSSNNSNFLQIASRKIWGTTWIQTAATAGIVRNDTTQLLQA